MVLFDDVVEILTLADLDALLMFMIVILDRRRVGTALVDIDQAWFFVSLPVESAAL